MLTLYYSRGTCSLASHIALEDAGADYIAERIDFASNQQQSPPYLAINPKGRVPALVAPHGVLTETPAILGFIAQSFPEAKLAPVDPFGFAEAQAFASYLCSTVHVIHAHRPRASRWADEERSHEDMRRKSPANMRACFAFMDERMFKGPWALGENYSFVDPYLFTLARWLPVHGVDVAEFPRLAQHGARMDQRAGVVNALAMEAG